MIRSGTQISYTDISETYLDCLRQGKNVNVEELAKRFPQYASRIVKELPLMAALDQSLSNRNGSTPQIDGYRIIGEIGRGASAVVYKAKSDEGKLVAIKLVYFYGDETTFSRLDREIECLKRLNHPNIIRVHDFGFEDNCVYIVTDYIEGVTLADLNSAKPSFLAKYWGGELRKNYNLLAEWGLEIAHALESIHASRIIHRDIKPSNLLIDQAGKCWIIDFGLAKLSESGMTVTRSKQVAGTPRFMAPEMLRGIVDVRCDIHSLGRTLFELASSDNSGDIEADLAAEVPPQLKAIIQKACESDPERRYQTAQELVAVLSRYLDGKTPCDRRRVGKRMSEVEFKTSMRKKVHRVTTAAVFSFGILISMVAAPFLVRSADDQDAIGRDGPNSERLQKFAAVVEDEDSGFVEVIGEVVKSSVISETDDRVESDEVVSKIDQIVNKVSTEGLKPGELDHLMKSYRDSPLMHASKARALHHSIRNSGMSQQERLRCHTTLEAFTRAVVNKRIHAEAADRMLASLFHGEVPRLEEIVSIPLSDEALRSWFHLIETSFSEELKTASTENYRANHELGRIIDDYLQQRN